MLQEHPLLCKELSWLRRKTIRKKRKWEWLQQLKLKQGQVQSGLLIERLMSEHPEQDPEKALQDLDGLDLEAAASEN
jgi:hypothetical protein